MMFPRIVIRSRRGNLVLGFLGAIYTLFAVAVFLWYLIDTWAAASLMDRLLQLMILGGLIVAVWFVSIAAANLGYTPNHQRHRH